MDLVCVGACYLDIILRQVSPPPRRGGSMVLARYRNFVPYYPDEDSKLRASNLQVRRGGNFRLYLLTCLPPRNASATVRIIESFGVDTSVDFSRCIFRDNNEEPVNSYIIRSSATGSRTLVNYNDRELLAESSSSAESLGNEYAWFHSEGRIPAATLHCIQWLRRSKPKARVSVEVEKPGQEGLENLVAEADVVFFSRSWAKSELYTGAEQCLQSHLFCTWGSQGAAYLSPDGAIVSCLATQPGHTIRVIEYRAKLSFVVQLATCKVQREGFNDLGFKASRCLVVASYSASRLEVDE
ncbi:Ribokinase-like protein [Xylaria sp. FL1777]|nr:Ribokinase-like protein [Xylaria sp. FL1777]